MTWRAPSGLLLSKFRWSQCLVHATMQIGQQPAAGLPRAKSTDARPASLQESTLRRQQGPGKGQSASNEELATASTNDLEDAFKEDADLYPSMRLMIRAFGDTILPFHPSPDLSYSPLL